MAFVLLRSKIPITWNMMDDAASIYQKPGHLKLFEVRDHHMHMFMMFIPNM
jgi:hypothetical protein